MNHSLQSNSRVGADWTGNSRIYSTSMTSKSETQLRAIQDEKEHTKQRIKELHEILSSDDKSIVEQSMAKVELSGLEKIRHVTWASSTEVPTTGIVSKTREKLEHEITIIKEHVRREKEIKRIQQDIRSNHEVESIVTKHKLEERLRPTQEAIEALIIDEAAEMIKEIHNFIQDTDNIQGPGNVAQAHLSFEDRDPELSIEQSSSPDGQVGRERPNALVEELLTEASERKIELDDWKSKAERVSAACITLSRDVEEREKRIQKLECCFSVQADRIVSLLQDVDERDKNIDKLQCCINVQEDHIATLCAVKTPILERKGSRRFSATASNNPSFSATLKQASMSEGMDEQIRKEAKIEMAALQERLTRMDEEKATLQKKLQEMKAILDKTSSKKPRRRRKEQLVYQLSCKKCNNHKNYIGTTNRDLKTTMAKHFDHVVDAAKGKKKGVSKSKTNKVANDDNKTNKSKPNQKQGHEDWISDFAQHFAEHCKSTMKLKLVSEKDIIHFCRENVKVEVLKRSDGSELYWEDRE